MIDTALLAFVVEAFTGIVLALCLTSEVRATMYPLLRKSSHFFVRFLR
jgi:hypothetical protein